MIKVLSFIFLMAATLYSQVMAGTGVLSDDLLRTSVELTSNLVENFPPQTHYILNVGPTTVGMSSSLRNRFPSATAQTNYFTEVPITGIKNFKHLNDQEIKKIFDSMLPDESVLKGRTLVLNRTLWEGQSIGSFALKFLDYLKKNRPGIKLSYNWVTYHKNENALDVFKRTIGRIESEYPGTFVRGVVETGHERYADKMIHYLDYRDTTKTPREHLTRYMTFKEQKLEDIMKNGCCTKNLSHSNLDEIDAITKDIYLNPSKYNDTKERSKKTASKKRKAYKARIAAMNCLMKQLTGEY